MAYGRGTEAYNLNTKAYSYGAVAAPARRRERPARKRQEPRLIRKSAASLRAERKRSGARAAEALLVCTLLFSMAALLIYSHVLADELDRELSAAQSELSVLQSENTRLNMELDSRISLEKVDDYAQNELGMVKAENYQVSYVDLKSADSTELSSPGRLKTLRAFLN